MWISLMLAGAILWRLRGGLLNDVTGRQNAFGMNDTAVRLIWSFGMSAAYWLGHPLPWWRVAILAAAFFAGTTIIGWFGALSADTARNVALMSLSGTLRMAFVVAALLSAWPLLAGVLCGPVYWLGYKIPRPASWLVWPELLWGAVIGASLCLAS